MKILHRSYGISVISDHWSILEEREIISLLSDLANKYWVVSGQKMVI
jgi:hypothetical protein